MSAPHVLRPALGNTYAIRRLRVFLQVARHPTLTEACQVHGIAAATLTNQLKRLEQDLGGPLLIRAGRGRHLEVTPLGRDVIEAIETWAHTLADSPRQTWDRAMRHRPPRTPRKPRPRPDDAPAPTPSPNSCSPPYGRLPAASDCTGSCRPPLTPRSRRSAGRPASASSLTVQIQHLERDLQGQLLGRGQCGHRMRPTAFGNTVLATAQPYTDRLTAHLDHESTR
ncbi:LysR family transcriptional regulator [Streptomyces sp. NPDC014733]|uniref:helix-turn-helix domain-containing protein n=1 Tax=Streptomyces sp. NPDC014733 TaxID=3364885 RepID=UPI0036F7A597